MAAEILIVDDEADIRTLIQGILEDEGYATRQAGNSQQAYERIAERVPHLVILDIWLQNSEHDGLQILETIKAENPFVPVLMISGHGTIETAVSAIKQGAYDFIEKPFKSDRLLVMIQRALETAKLRRENQSLRVRAEGPTELLGSSPLMAGLRQTIGKVAQTNSRVLLTGEPGTGKDVAARVIHRLSQRADGPFMALNCAVMRPERLEVELFGSASTEGAHEAATEGVLERSHGGTLFLDEVADMPLETQGKIVRALQEQKFRRVGGRDQIEVDVRIIASTNRDLQSLIAEGLFREDLFYRLNVVPIDMPPLRTRPQDIGELAAYFAHVISAQSGTPACTFSDAALAAMQAYSWPGNVRQLRNVVEWVTIMGSGAAGREAGPESLPPEISAIVPANGESLLGTDLFAVPLREAREMFERDYLLSQIQRFGGNISRTAQFVGMERSALHRKLKQLGITDLPKQGGEEPVEAVQQAGRRIA